MAQTDFDFYDLPGTYPSTFIGGPDGSPKTHASFTNNKLAGEGTYCRRFYETEMGGSRKVVGARIKSAVAGGALVSVPSTKTISLRAWLRLTDATPSSNVRASVGLSAKAAGIGPADAYYSWGGGYHVILGAHDQNPARLVFSRTTGVETLIKTLNLDTWHKIRMDVKASGADDDIKIYTGTGTTGSEVWTLEYSETILASSGNYVAWNHATYKYNGFGVHLQGTNGTHIRDAYIDRFQALLK